MTLLIILNLIIIALVVLLINDNRRIEDRLYAFLEDIYRQTNRIDEGLYFSNINYSSVDSDSLGGEEEFARQSYSNGNSRRDSFNKKGFLLRWLRARYLSPYRHLYKSRRFSAGIFGEPIKYSPDAVLKMKLKEN